MTIKTIKSSDAARSSNAGALADRLKTALAGWPRGERSRKEVNEGKHSGYSSTHNSVVLSSSDILNGIDSHSAIPHLEIKKENRSSADMKHSLAKEHESNRASSNVTPASCSNSVTRKASRAQSDSDHVSTSCSSAQEHTRLVIREQQPSSMLDNIDLGIGIGLALAGSFLIATGVGLGVAVVAGVTTIALSAGVGSTVGAAAAGSAIGAAAAGSAVGAAVGTGIAAGLDAVTVDAVVETGIDVANSIDITR